MKACFKIAVWGCVASVVSIGGAPAKTARTDTIKMCWEKAHKESPVDTGNDVNTSALNRGAMYLYISCMKEQGLRP
jgi:hypothetical protein